MKKNATLVILGAAAVAAFLAAGHTRADEATTTVSIRICGNGIVEPGEFCDDASLNGQYATSTAGRHCNSTCTAFGPYCGDAILQQAYGEQCDSSGANCDSSCHVQAVPPPPPPSGGGNFNPGTNTAPRETRIILQGKAYPDDPVNILQDGQLIATIKADDQANFSYGTSAISPGVSTFSFWGQDDGGLRSPVISTTLTITANALTTVSGIYLPPTISLAQSSVKKGDAIVVSGVTVPGASVTVRLQPEETVKAQVSARPDNGTYAASLDTKTLADQSVHQVTASFQTTASGTPIQSGFSQDVNVYIGTAGSNATKLLADLNGDHKVNLVDFSVLLYYFNSSGPVGDLNGDHTVNLNDFSIMLFYWTG